MRQYVLFLAWLLAILFMGIAESVVAVPVCAVGLLIFLVKQQRWWLRLVSIAFVGVVWGIALSISPTVLVGILLLVVWLNAWMNTKIQQRSSYFWATLIGILLIGVARGITVAIGPAIFVIVQLATFWFATRWLNSNRTEKLHFFIPPQPLDVKKQT